MSIYFSWPKGRMYRYSIKYGSWMITTKVLENWKYPWPYWDVKMICNVAAASWCATFTQVNLFQWISQENTLNFTWPINRCIPILSDYRAWNTINQWDSFRLSKSSKPQFTPRKRVKKMADLLPQTHLFIHLLTVQEVSSLANLGFQVDVFTAENNCGPRATLSSRTQNWNHGFSSEIGGILPRIHFIRRSCDVVYIDGVNMCPKEHRMVSVLQLLLQPVVLTNMGNMKLKTFPPTVFQI